MVNLCGSLLLNKLLKNKSEKGLLSVAGLFLHFIGYLLIYLLLIFNMKTCRQLN